MSYFTRACTQETSILYIVFSSQLAFVMLVRMLGQRFNNLAPLSCHTHMHGYSSARRNVNQLRFWIERSCAMHPVCIQLHEHLCCAQSTNAVTEAIRCWPP
jgi:hypothetical protein